METLVKILHLIGFTGVSVNSDPLVLYAGGVLLLSILALLGVLTMFLSFLLIVLGYNQNFLNYLGKWIPSKLLNRLVILSRVTNLYTILIELFFFSSIMYTLISSSYKLLSAVS